MTEATSDTRSLATQAVTLAKAGDRDEPFDIRVIVAPVGDRSADILARIKADLGTVPKFAMVGQGYRISTDEEPEEWKCWLWPESDVHPAMDRSTEAMTRPSCGDLEVLLNKRLKREGRWWK